MKLQNHILYKKQGKWSPLLVSILFLVIQSSYSQIDSLALEQLTNKFEELSEGQDTDQIYLQTDKDIYYTQENVWFKGTVLDSRELTPSNKSSVLFVQLVQDIGDRPVWEEKYEIENGFVNGHLYLKDTLAAGSYSLTAYSPHSFYKGQKDFYALKKIKIIKESKPLQAKKKDSTLHFSTFPEGGNLVSGIESRLAFKAVDSKGFPVKISGTLYENNQAIIKFESIHAGMGSFLFTPNVDKSYKIKLKDQKEDKAYTLPKIYTKGKVMRFLGTNRNHAFFKIAQTPNREETVYIRTQTRGTPYNVLIGRIKDTLQIKIPIKDLPRGIAEVTLFNKELVPIAERLIYVNAHKKIHITARLDKSEYRTREKVQLKIRTTDEKGLPVVSHLGLRVFGHLYKNHGDPKTIESHYLLTSQLKGNLYDPSYYFDEKNKDRTEALNVLLLTQGWRAYQWTDANLKARQHRTPLIFDHYDGTIKELQKSAFGKVKIESQKSALDMVKTELQKSNLAMVKLFSFVKGDKKYDLKPLGLLMTDSLGRFRIEPDYLKLVGYDYLYVGPLVHKMDLEGNYFKTINANRAGRKNQYPIKTLKKRYKQPKPFVLSSKVNLLDEVVVTAKKKKRRHRDKRLEALKNFLPILDWVCHNDILNCTYHSYERGLRKPVIGKVYNVLNHDVKGSWLKTIRYSKTSKYNKTYIQYKDYDIERTLKALNWTRIKGYYPKKEYYSPVYDKTTENDGFEDTRNSLYWKPDIITNAQGEAEATFYCSDINSLFLGEIEGVSGTGLLGSDKFELSVVKRDD